MILFLKFELVLILRLFMNIASLIFSLRKLTARFRKKDDSPELKRGEIKGMMIRVAREKLPDFDYLTYKNSSYYFQRIRTAAGLNVSEIISIFFSLKEGIMDCSIGSFLNKQYIFEQSYSPSLINANASIIPYKYNTCSLPWEKACYFHNGRVRTTGKVVEEIFTDCRKYALKVFDKRIELLQESPLIAKGLEYIFRLEIDKDALKKALEDELKQSDYIISRLHHPIYMELKGMLQGIKGMDRETRKNIPMLAYDLLELYADGYEKNTGGTPGS